jgi:hypothetical protein
MSWCPGFLSLIPQLTTAKWLALQASWVPHPSLPGLECMYTLVQWTSSLEIKGQEAFFFLFPK